MISKIIILKIIKINDFHSNNFQVGSFNYDNTKMIYRTYYLPLMPNSTESILDYRVTMMVIMLAMMSRWTEMIIMIIMPSKMEVASQHWTDWTDWTFETIEINRKIQNTQSYLRMDGMDWMVILYCCDTKSIAPERC